MTLGSHQRTIGATQVHLTPRCIIDALGPFDLGAGMEESGTAAVLSKPTNPAAYFVAVEGRIEPYAAMPLTMEPVLQFRDVFGRTVPRARISGARVKLSGSASAGSARRPFSSWRSG